MAARRLGIIKHARRTGPLADNPIPRRRLSGAGFRRPRRALLESACARRAVRADAQHRPAELAHAALESVCYQTFDLWAAMRADWPDAKAANTVLRVDGGMTASDWTMQRLADLLDAPVDRPMIQETTALGAAYLAGLARRRLSRAVKIRRQLAAGAPLQADDERSDAGAKTRRVGAGGEGGAGER